MPPFLNRSKLESGGQQPMIRGFPCVRGLEKVLSRKIVEHSLSRGRSGNDGQYALLKMTYPRPQIWGATIGHKI
ncbi:hypothetical protein TNCV_281901 [Trichonephila clavipes]|nr:hypothetical protein TNCV_281901 [Trichonephila clavipes]